MALPRRLARFNKRYSNRLIEPVVRRLAGFVVVHHHGRTTNTAYQTPLYAFAAPDHDDDHEDSHDDDNQEDDHDLIITLTYGPRVDWLLNVRSGGGEVEQAGIRRQIRTTGLVPPSQARACMPGIVRAALSIAGVRDFVRVELEPRPHWAGVSAAE